MKVPSENGLTLSKMLIVVSIYLTISSEMPVLGRLEIDKTLESGKIFMQELFLRFLRAGDSSRLVQSVERYGWHPLSPRWT